MTSFKSAWKAAPWAAMAIAAAGPAAAQSQAGTEGWQFEVALYGWFPAIGGSTSFPTVGASPSIDVSTGDVISALNMAFMGVLQVRNGPWGLWNDLFYSDLGGSKGGTRNISIGGQPLPIGVDANLNLDVKTWIWTVAGTYALKSDSEGNMDMMFGMRMLDMTNTLDWSFRGTGPGLLPPRTGNAEVSDTFWDGIVGLKGRAFVGEERRWFVPFYVDVGAGQSKLTWQINAGLGYQFDWGAVVASWRYLDYSFKSDSKITDLSLNGPLIGVAFKF
ncbi:MAG TPA: hypothetical protein VET87_00585 [Rubrivivax sp.]|nr:hypothetical protein [Rubrivivax sp.]